MRALHIAAVCLLIAVHGHIAIAQDALPQAMDERFSDEVEPLIPSNDHPGLLGKRFIQGRYQQFHLNDSVWEMFDSSFQGFDAKLNIPLVTPGRFGDFGVDLHAGHSWLTSGGAEYFGFPIDASLGARTSAESYHAGATIFGTSLNSLRPFAQLGVIYTESNATFDFGFLRITDSEYDTDFGMVLGVEADVHERIAIRLGLDLEFQYQFDDSLFSAESIIWPSERLFLRSGVFAPLNADSLGFAVGAGLVF